MSMPSSLPISEARLPQGPFKARLYIRRAFIMYIRRAYIIYIYKARLYICPAGRTLLQQGQAARLRPCRMHVFTLSDSRVTKPGQGAQPRA